MADPWSHTSPSHPLQSLSLARTRGGALGPAVLGQPREQWPSVFPATTWVPAAHSAKGSCTLEHQGAAGPGRRSSQVQGQSGAEDSSPRDKVQGASTSPLHRGLNPACPGPSRLDRCELFAFQVHSLVGSGQCGSTPRPYTFPSSQNSPVNKCSKTRPHLASPVSTPQFILGSGQQQTSLARAQQPPLSCRENQGPGR